MQSRCRRAEVAMSLPDEDVIVSLDPPGGPCQVDLRDYAGNYIAFSEDDQRIVAHAGTLPELFVLLQQLDERGERYVIGGYVPEDLRQPDHN